MKGRKLAALLCLILAFSFAFSGCSSKSNNETTENVTNAPEKADTEAKADTENKDTADTAGETAPTEAEAPDAADAAEDNSTEETETPETSGADTDIIIDAGNPDEDEEEYGEDGEDYEEDYNIFNLADYSIDVTLGQYRGISTVKEEISVSDEEIENEIASFCESYYEETEVTDRPCELGDIVTLDFVGTLNGEEFDGGSGEDEEFYLGQGTTIDGFDEGIVGHSIGESFSFEVTFPEEYSSNPDLANQTVQFNATVKSITNYVIPEFTDELVAENSDDYKTTEEYKAYIIEYLTEEKTAEAEEAAMQNIYNTAIANAVYTGQLDEAIEASYKEAIDYYEMVANNYYGVDAETLFNYMYGLDADGYYAMLREQAEYSVKFTLLLDKIIEEEALTLSDEEFKTRYNEIFFEQYGFESEEAVSEEFTEEEIQDIVGNGALREKAEQIISDTAIIG